jgi:hypothetical protein
MGPGADGLSGAGSDAVICNSWEIEMRTVSFMPAASLPAISMETDDGGDVVIGRTGKTPKVEVTFASSTLTGLEVGVGRE